MDKREVKSIRDRLGMEQPDFAKMLGVDTRTVARWEVGTASPTGTAEAVLAGLRESFAKAPSQAGQIAAIVAGAVALGGVAYLVVKLFDALLTKPPDKSGGNNQG